MADFDFYKDAKFITDQPAETDEFSSQAHARVAGALVTIVVSSDGGRAVGLEGTWGSGKSTVIDFALAQFEKWNKDRIPKQRVFVFDAWAHQGDPLRRVFLEELIEYLAGVRAIDKAKWGAKLEQLRSKRKRTTETRAEKLSWVARITLLVVPLYPLAYGFLLEASKQDSKISDVLSPGWLVTIAGLLISAPYVVALFTWLNRINDPSMSGQSVIWAFKKQTDHVTTEQLIREDEATTVEFNREFDELVTDAKEKGNRLVIVLDNLDRLANDQIREIWATMRNFFAAAPGSSRKETLKNVWLVVPVDRQHIETVFSEGAVNSDEQRTRGFVEKTFEVVLRVPPLLLSRWREFFEKKLHEAFGTKVSPDDSYRVFRLFELYQSLYPTVITPRAIKAYINKLVGQAKLSGDSIPIEYQSLYVLYRDKIASEFNRLQDSTILDAPILVSISDANWTKYLAAAHFNVEADEALEILLGPEIEAALLDNNHVRLNELAKTLGFESILHGIVASKSRIWASDNPTSLFNISATLARIGADQSPARGHIWRDLISGLTAVSKPLSTTDLTAIGIKNFVEHTDAKRLPDLTRRLKTVFTEIKREAADSSTPAGFAWFKVVEGLAESTKSLDPKEWDSIFSNIHIQPYASFVLGVAEGAATSSTLNLKRFAAPVSADDLANVLVPQLQSSETPENVRTIVEALVNVPAWINWNLVVSASLNRLQQNEPVVSAATSEKLLAVLRLAGPSQKVARTALKQLNDDGSLHGLFEIERKAEQVEPMGEVLCDFTVLKAQNWSGPNDHPKYGSLNDTNSFLSQLQSEPEKYVPLVDAYSKSALKRNMFGTVLKMALPADKSREIFRSALKIMAKQVEAKHVSAPDIVNNFSALEGIVGADLSHRLLGLLDSVDIGPVMGEKKWKSIPLPVLTASQALNTRKFPELVAAINQGLNDLSAAELLEVLKTEGNELVLMFQLQEWGEININTTPLFDALNNYNRELVAGAKFPSTHTDRWHLLPSILSDSQRTHFYEGLRDFLTEADRTSDILIRTIRLYGPEFLSNADLSGREDVVLRRVIDPLLAATTKESLECIATNTASFKSMLDGTSSSNREFVVGRIQTILARSDEKVRADVSNLAQLLGMTPDLERAEEEAQNHIRAIEEARSEVEGE